MVQLHLKPGLGKLPITPYHFFDELWAMTLDELGYSHRGTRQVAAGGLQTRWLRGLCADRPRNLALHSWCTYTTY